jgi:NAD(P)H-hydrate epimerase
MKIPTIKQIRDCDSYTIQHEPIASIDLVERAAQACFDKLTAMYGKQTRILVVCGMGNNGSDGLALTRLLLEEGYCCDAVMVKHGDRFSPECEQNLNRLKEQHPQNVLFCQPVQPTIPLQDYPLIVDALIGSGLHETITDPLLKLVVEQINACSGFVFAVDVPSGFLSEAPTPPRAIAVKADFTLSFQFPKLGFMFAEGYPFVGEWDIADIGLHPQAIDKIETECFYIDKPLIESILVPRQKFAHKGLFGHGLLVAGSESMMGAAVLSAKAALRAGIGLLSVHVPKIGYGIVQTAAPEAICRQDENENAFSGVRFDTLTTYQGIAVGPGLGTNPLAGKGVRKLVRDSRSRIIFDADAIRVMGETKAWFGFLPKDCIFTPHIKEFEVLVEKTASWQERMEVQKSFSIRHTCVVILKGAHTCITTAEGDCYFNSTGNPGMATAGSGDVLTGILLALAANGYTSREAAILGVWLHGMAAQEAIAGRQSVESLTAGDIVEHLGAAFKKAHPDGSMRG